MWKEDAVKNQETGEKKTKKGEKTLKLRDQNFKRAPLIFCRGGKDVGVREERDARLNKKPRDLLTEGGKKRTKRKRLRGSLSHQEKAGAW